MCPACTHPWAAQPLPYCRNACPETPNARDAPMFELRVFADALMSPSSAGA
ncbi:hypothetical protein ATPR_1847 [Acetobacter tropicalis NBRC 101654]|uniref:Uncharacterized protein n=1 Tax=Acetobacter tropicalis NBRC 101654 TaxID=749388 RepID=F7VEP8_9PROT|nr:hypothetical protein ATPR_1847 [Acetobacter tropicalis NBRC 101654]